MDCQKILNVIKKHKTFLISTHVNPDPDALASELVFAMYLKSLGKKVFIINNDDVPARFLFLPGVHMIKRVNEKRKINFDVAVVVDCGDLSRIGKVRNVIGPDKMIINIDHHITNDCFGTLNLLNPQASSAAEVIFDFFKRAKFSLNKEMAILLYVGIMTDTGSFRYENTTAHTHAIVAQLMKFDFPSSEFYRKLYETIPLDDLRNFAKVVDKLDPLFDGKVVCLELHKNIVRKFSKEFDLRDKIFRYLRAIKGVEILVILTEQEKSKTRVNFRSQGKMDVAELAFCFKGGGHSRASGCMVDSDLKTARTKVLKQVKKVLNK